MFCDLKGPAAIGLDARGKRIYAVCLDTRDLFWPSLIDQRKFTSLDEFEVWWNCHDWWPDHLRDPDRATHDVRVAVDAGARDRLGVSNWLQDQMVPLDHFRPVPNDEEIMEQFEAWVLPNAFRRAFALAFFALYRMQGPLVAEWLASELKDTESRLRELSIRLGRLHQALRYHDPGPASPISARADAPF